MADAKKPSYFDELEERVSRFCYRQGYEPEWEPVIFDFVKAECLKSYKNGLAAAQKRSSAPQPESALEAGKLRPRA